MLAPDHPWTPTLLALALTAALATIVIRAIRKDRGDYRRFRRTLSTKRRQTYYRRWLIESFLVNGGIAAVLLALAWASVAPALAAGRAIPPVPTLVEAFSSAPDTWPEIVVLVVVFGVVGLLTVPLVFLRQSLGEEAASGRAELPTVGDIGPMIPRNRAELRWGWLLSINAGIVEELLFRLAVPAVLFGITGSALLSFAGATALFGLVHVYQGPAGMIVSAVIGALLTLVYLATGSILIAILVHALFDLRSLVLLPWMMQRMRARNTG